jgi:hypothetical protein
MFKYKNIVSPPLILSFILLIFLFILI